MRPVFLFLAFFFFSLSCERSPFAQTFTAVETATRISQLEKGMSEAEVKKLLGCPKKISLKTSGGQTYVVWYYVTKGIEIGREGFTDHNFTPLIFKDGKLYGWGYGLHYKLFNSKNPVLQKQELPPKPIEEILKEIEKEPNPAADPPEPSKAPPVRTDDTGSDDETRRQKTPEKPAPVFWE
ncbi:MAG: DUF3192 domain-containing protein [Parachlamydiales bacterium]|jgi:outer membrane protein assembly factor BamE (lipoprotein component of BamABCDE complex)